MFTWGAGRSQGDRLREIGFKEQSIHMLRHFGFAAAVTVAAAFGLSSLPSRAETPPAPSALPATGLPAPAPPAEAPPAEAQAPAPVVEAPAGFRVTAVEIAAERDQPQACFTFSGRLDKSLRPGYAGFVVVAPTLPALSVVARDNTLCVQGLGHGATFQITLREGLPGADGVRLAAAEQHDVAVPNRAPSLAFRGAGYILPRIGPEDLALRSVNIDHAQLRVLRIADRNLVEKIYAGKVGQTLSEWDIGEMVEKAGKPVWQGEVPIAVVRNAPVVTSFPIKPILGGLEPGVYLASARADASDRKNGAASQWFVVSDLGLTSFFGDDGLVVFARSLTKAEPVAGVELHLLTRSGKELATRVTGADGIARFEAEVAHKTGDDAVQALFAYGAGGDFSFLDLAAAGFDLTDRGASGRASPGPLDSYLYTERAIYRPGETVDVTALLRNADVAAVTGQPLLLKLWRPDGFEADRRKLDDAGAGSVTTNFALPDTAVPGVWSITAHLEPGSPAIGRADFTVHAFLRPRLDFTLAANHPALAPGEVTSVAIEGHYLFGAAPAGLPGELSMTLRPAEAPFPSHTGFHFGLAQEKFTTQRTELPGFTTSRAGKASVDLPAFKLPDSSHPLEAVVRSTIFDIGGQPVSRELVLPVQHQPFAIGLRPRFENAVVPEGATAAVEVIAVGADGTTVDKPDLSYELYEEEYDYRWFEANGHWDYETVVHDHRVTGGPLAVTAAAPAVIEEPVAAGRYRLEVFDAKSGVATSLRFAAGWWVTPSAGSRPDKVEVSVMLPRYHGGDTARVHIRPPYDSQVLVAIVDRTVRKTITQRISAKGAFLDIPVDTAWTGGVTIIATAYAAADTVPEAPPPRAIGVGWLAVDPAPHTLDVKLSAPPSLEPERAVTVGVTVRDAAGAPLPADTPAFLTLAAVDDSVLQLTEQTAPDPIAYYLSQPRVGVELRDVYGRLLEPGSTDQAAARTAPAEKRRLRQIQTLPDRDSPVISWFSGIVRIGADGTASLPITLPNFDGRLRLMAVAWTANRIGHAETTVTVRAPVAVAVNLPRFLAPGDHASVDVTLTNQTGGAGDYQITLTADGALSLVDGTAALTGPKRGHRAVLTRRLVAEHPGVGSLRLEISGPDGFHLARTQTLTVRAPDALALRHVTRPLPVGATETPPKDLAEGLQSDSVVATLAIGPRPELDRAGLLLALDRPFLDGTGQLAAGIASLIAGSDVALAIESESAPSRHDRIQQAVDRLAALQRADGGFGRWSSADDADPWLSAFVVDVLGRARDAGYHLPAATLESGFSWLKRLLANGWFEDRELPTRAYALYLMARAKLVDEGGLAYFQQTYGAKLQTDLARADIAAALAALGDTRAAAAAFEQIDRRSGGRGAADDLGDGGSALRDLAGAVALAAESGAVGREPLQALADRLVAKVPSTNGSRFSPQEQAWLALAARAVTDHAGPPVPVKIAIDERVVEPTRPLYQRLNLAAPPALRNAGAVALSLTATAVGLPAESPTVTDQGFALTRTMFDMSGKPIKPDAIRLNDLMVVILEGRALEPQKRQVMVTDLLPGGFDIENVRLGDSAQLGDLSWLGELSPARHVDYRHDRFAATLDLDETHPGFRVVYLARAVAPGDFAQPGAILETTDAPSQFARLAVGRLQIHAEKE